jgi:hypothetical protein
MYDIAANIMTLPQSNFVHVYVSVIHWGYSLNLVQRLVTFPFPKMWWTNPRIQASKWTFRPCWRTGSWQIWQMRFGFGGCVYQVGPKVFYGVQIRRLWGPWQCIKVVLSEEIHVYPCCMGIAIHANSCKEMQNSVIVYTDFNITGNWPNLSYVTVFSKFCSLSCMTIVC